MVKELFVADGRSIEYEGLLYRKAKSSFEAERDMLNIYERFKRTKES